MRVPAACVQILLRWDNNFSYFTSKQLKYTVSCINDDSGSLETLISSSSAKPVASEEQKGQ
jgi:hypothetical protein